jgi:hypothetical protein
MNINKWLCFQILLLFYIDNVLHLLFHSCTDLDWVPRFSLPSPSSSRLHLPLLRRSAWGARKFSKQVNRGLRFTGDSEGRPRKIEPSESPEYLKPQETSKPTLAVA